MNTKMNQPYVLIVDDDELAIQILTQILQKLGYSARSFESGQQAIDFLLKLDIHSLPTAIISDIMMDDGDGIDILSMTRNHPQMANLPFIFFSNVNQEIFKELIQPHSCEAFLSKPIDFQKVKSIFDTLKNQIAS